MKYTTSTGEKIVYALLSLIGFNRNYFPSTPVQKTPRMANVYLKSYMINGKQVIDICRVTDVRANPLPYHKERGWRKNAMIHRGYYRCRSGAYQGEIEKRDNGVYKFYIINPPIEVLNGSHKACFTSNGNNRFHIHFGTNSNNLDSGIMAVERLLSQSLNRR